MNSKLKSLSFIVVVLIVVFGFKYWQLRNNFTINTAQDMLNLCVEHVAIGYHIHPQIKISVNGKPFSIPAGIGIESGCMKVIHTHDDLPKIHVEAPKAFDFTLKDFFDIWGKSLSKAQVIDYKASNGYNFEFLENGRQIDNPETIVLSDNKSIEIKISKIKEEPDK